MDISFFISTIFTNGVLLRNHGLAEKYDEGFLYLLCANAISCVNAQGRCQISKSLMGTEVRIMVNAKDGQHSCQCNRGYC